MASKVRRGVLPGRALQEALIQCHLEWRSPAGGISSAPSSPSKRRAIELEGETLRHSHKVALVRTITTLKGGLHVRKTFNDSHRCRDTRCQLQHV